MSYSNGLAALQREAASIAEWDKGKGKNNKGLGKGMGKTDSSKGKGKDSNASLWDDPRAAEGLFSTLQPFTTLAFPDGGFPGSGFPGGGFPDGGFLTPLPDGSFSTLQPYPAAASPAAATPLPEEATALPDEVMSRRRRWRWHVEVQQEAAQEAAMEVQPLALAGLIRSRQLSAAAAQAAGCAPAHLTAAARGISSSSSNSQHS
jgi:hypothetical protein